MTPEASSTPELSTPLPLEALTESEQSQTHGSVLHIINGEHFSGAERVQEHLGKRLGDYGFNPLFACVKQGKFKESAGLKDDQVYETPMKHRFDFRVIDQLKELMFAENVQILHAHTPRTALVTAITASRVGVPWVYHVHSPTFRDSTRGLINRVNGMVESFSIRRCSLLMTVSKSLRREMLRLRVPRSRLAVVPNGVPAIDPVVHSDRLDRQEWSLGMVALMRPRKGVEVALEAMQSIKANYGKDVRLRMIGGFETTAYEQEMKKMAYRLEVEDVVDWVGFTNEVPSEIRKLDALLLPSLFGEGMPMVVLEAIAAGVPVVATQVEGTPEVIRDGREGFLAEPRDAQSFASCIRRMIAERTTWATMGNNALERHRQNFSDAKMAERVAKAYRRVLGIA